MTIKQGLAIMLLLSITASVLWTLVSRWFGLLIPANFIFGWWLGGHVK